MRLALTRASQLVCLLALSASSTLTAATLPSGFREILVASGLSNPTAMQFAPDGRLFVAEQGGRLRVIKDGVLLATPFLTVTVSSAGERGLLGIAFDPNFSVNRFVYIYYTATSPTVHNRISRFTASGDVAVAGSEAILFELDNLSSATNHNGGALAFGPDGKLYAAVGENATAAHAQSMTTVFGKMLRLNPDGSIPSDNPFYWTATGKNRAIWALGLRNPFTFAFHPAGSPMYINDVGQNTWEEINAGAAAANYGWPDTEGPTTDSRFTSPVSAYTHASGGCAITGGAFYAPPVAQFPSAYTGDYFFADYCGGWIRKLNAGDHTVTTFATGISAPVDLKVAADGSLYYLARGGGAVYRVEYGASAPSITSHPANRSVQPGVAVTFSVRASGASPLQYQWQRNGVNISGATGADYTFTAALTDNGARYRAQVTNEFGSVVSNEGTLTVTANRPPTGSITQPSAGTLYRGGMVVTYAGTGSDAEDGSLPASAFTWQVDFLHDTHSHPFIAARSGATSGTFTIPTTGETSTNVRYRIFLTVRDSQGLVHQSQRDILPQKVTLSLASSPPGLQLRLDGQPVNAPHSFESVVGMMRNLSAPSPQTLNGTGYEFVSWSSGRPATHDLATPATSTAYTATYRTAVGGTGNGLTGAYYNNTDFTNLKITRVDPVIDFAWSYGAPHPTMSPDTFSVRWTGQLEAPSSETYTFYTQSNDGVRLWIDGQLVIDNWTNHALTENRANINLVAGRRYGVRLEFYEATGTATARLLWSSPTTSKAVVPASRLFADATGVATPIRVNFQTAAAPVPAGYLRDAGAVFGDRGNGYVYGWNADNAAQTRDRNATNSPDQRYDTLIYMQRPANPNATWEIAVANATYRVRVVAGDPSYFNYAVAIAAEGVLAVSGTTSSAGRWLEGTVTVTVADGKLTISNASSTTANEICFVEITRQ